MRQKAQTMVFEAVMEPFAPHTFPLPSLVDGEVLIEVDYATICTSDLHTYYGRRGGPTHSILGHEIVGKVAALPANGAVDFEGNLLMIGDRVTWSVYAHEPDAEMEQRGIPQKAKGLYKYGHEAITEGHALNGGFSTHCHLKKGTAIFRLPKQMTLQEAAPLNCTHATMAGALRLAGEIKDRNVLVSGTGMLGLSACAMAKEKGAKQVFALDPNGHKRKMAGQFGADFMVDAQMDAVEIGKEFSQKGGVDVVLETSGSPEAVERAIQWLNIGGVAVLVGSVYPQRKVAIDAETVVRRLLTIKGLHNYAPQDLAMAIQFLAKVKTRYPFRQLVEAEFPLNKLDEAFELGNQGGHFRVGIYPK